MPRPRSNLSQTVFVRYSPPNPAVTHSLLSEAFSEIGPVKKCSVIRSSKAAAASAAASAAATGTTDAPPDIDDAKRTKGYGFVRFASEEDAVEAVRTFHGTYLHLEYGDRVKLFVERASEATAATAGGAGGSSTAGKKKMAGEDASGAGDPEQSAATTANDDDHQYDQPPPHAQPVVDEVMSRRKRTARVIIRNLAFTAKESHVRRVMEEHFGSVVDVHLPTVPGSDVNQKGKKKKNSNKGGMVPRHRGFAFVTFENAVQAQKAVDRGNVEIKGRNVAIDFSVSKFHHQRMAEEGEEEQEEQHQQVEENENESKMKEEDDSSDDDKSESDSDSSTSNSSDSDDSDDDHSHDGSDNSSETEGDSDEESKADADSKDEEGKEPQQQQEQPTKERPKPKSDPRRTLFVRNVPFDATRTDLFEVFRHYGRIESIYLVKDRDTGVGKGTAFVRYEAENGSKRALEAAGSSSTGGPFVGGSDNLAGGEGLYLSGRRLLVDPAVDRDTASSLKVERDEDGKPLDRNVGKDRRNLYLTTEGRVASGTADEPGPWEELPESDRLKRGRAHQEKSSKLRSPLFFVNPLRLSFRNLAKHVDESDLKKLAVEGIKAGLESNLVSKDDIVAHWRASGDMTARDIVKKMSELEEAGESLVPPYDEAAGIRRHIPSVYIDRDFSGSTGGPKKDLPPSRGFGFVEFTHHAHALACLRDLNNNPAYSAQYATGGKKATELKKRQRKGGKKGKKGRTFDEEGEGGGADFVGDDGRVRVPRLIVEFTVENKAKARQQADHRAQQLANAEKQRAANRAAKKDRRMAEEADGGDKLKRKEKKKGRGAQQREKKRKLKEEGVADTTEDAINDEAPSKKVRRASHDDTDVTRLPEQPKIKKVKPPKKRKVDKEEQAFENMVKSYKQSFGGGKEKGKKGKGSEENGVPSNPREAVAKKRWFE
eukprot:CAMPEP_0178524190 /NCGR_PEP_ID=MMETSP0696-20121128/29507_1 /TAXON_ID=265572 /ORGANISM="Extubocellulus spinifer, Strain CCMP396" /LENGTH=937 /DNA_ID=CAMNT_0020155501 /DNA_START=216 /DNA_END=3029 /DNA_ORIENTATION=+